MTALAAILGAVRAIPWQAWAVAGLIAAGGLYGCHEYERGRAAASIETERQQMEKADAARREVDRLRGGADRSRVQQFDRD